MEDSLLEKVVAKVTGSDEGNLLDIAKTIDESFRDQTISFDASDYKEVFNPLINVHSLIMHLHLLTPNPLYLTKKARKFLKTQIERIKKTGKDDSGEPKVSNLFQKTL